MEEEELNSFPFYEMINGVEHSYRITQNYDRYDVEKDGIKIAELVHDECWQQISGELLSEELIESICKNIEARYD